MKFAVKIERNRRVVMNEIVFCAIDADSAEEAEKSALAYIKSMPNEIHWTQTVIDDKTPVKPRYECKVFNEADESLPDAVKEIFK